MSLVVELASNDGYLLQHYVAAGIEVLGIEPTPGPAAAARDKGIDTRQEFFGRELAAKLVAEGRRADVVHANNVLAHVADTNGFVDGIAALLKDDGVAVIEVHYVRDLIDHGQFDTIYHEHLCYFSVTAVERLFRRHGLYLNRVERIDIHGGSLRLFAERRDRREASVDILLDEERALGIDRFPYYADFARRVQTIRERLLRLLGDLKAGGARLAGYGAAAKGTILLNYVGLGPETLDFVVDRNRHKQGRWVPGVRLPILPPAALLDAPAGLRLDLALELPGRDHRSTGRIRQSRRPIHHSHSRTEGSLAAHVAIHFLRRLPGPESAWLLPGGRHPRAQLPDARHARGRAGFPTPRP